MLLAHIYIGMQKVSHVHPFSESDAHSRHIRKFVVWQYSLKTFPALHPWTPLGCNALGRTSGRL